MFQINRSSLRAALMVGAATASALSLSGPAQAAVVETVVVTGSHITSLNLRSTAPVTEATANDIKIQGVTKVEDLLNQMPQVFAGQNATVSNGLSGTSEVDLRGLGCDRTLVLVDGRRLPFGSPIDICADLNQIPTILVDRVEVLTGGASAVYGSDAVSGVVNFIMKKDFEGVMFDAQIGIYQHNNGNNAPGNIRAVIAGRALTNPSQFVLPTGSAWDGGGKQLSGMFGVDSADGKGNLTAYFTWRQNGAVLQGARDYSACALGAPTAGGLWTCGGSTTAYPGRFTDFATFNQTVNSATGNTFRAFNNATDQYNFGPLNYYQRPDERYAAGAIGHYEINPHFDVYTQLMFADYHTVGQIAPSGDFGNTSTINCGNPLLSAQELTTIHCTALLIATNASVPLYILRRNVEGGGRQYEIRDTSFRGVIGVRGEIANGWTYDLTGSYADVEYRQSQLNQLSVTRLKRALNVVSVAGVPTCQSVVDGTDPTCVPYDIFTLGHVTAAATNYLAIPVLQLGATTQESVGIVFNGDLGRYGWQSPWAADSIKTAFGAEYRIDRLAFLTDVASSSGDVAGSGGASPPVHGATKVLEGYAEANIPIVEDHDFAKAITLELAVRYSSYSAVKTWTYKAGAEWAPSNDVRFRASYDHAVRAPNVLNLFTPQGTNLFDMPTDPCGAGGYATLAACQSTPGAGAAPWYGSAAVNSPAGQYNRLQGGNPLVAPEQSDSFTVGVVLTPSFIPGFSASVDYFDVNLSKAISGEGAINVLASCYTFGVAADCAKIHRTATGTLWLGNSFVDDRTTNIGGVRTSGVDVNANYGLDLADWAAGSLTFSLNGTWLNKLKTNTGVGIIYDCVGLFAGNCGTPNPSWRHQARVGWETPWHDLVLTGTWRYYGSVNQKGGNPLLIGFTFPAQSYFDLSAAIPVMDSATLRLGVNNLFDRDPPLSAFVGTTGNGNTYPQVYDALGRYLFADVTAKL